MTSLPESSESAEVVPPNQGTTSYGRDDINENIGSAIISTLSTIRTATVDSDVDMYLTQTLTVENEMMTSHPPPPANVSGVINDDRHGSTPSTSQLPESANLKDNVSAHTRSRPRKRKALNASLECLCGSPVSPEDISDRKAVRCKKAGCETEWFHLDCVDLELVPRDYICKSCSPRAGAKHARWS